MAAKKQDYGNESISSLKGADRVRKRPAVIFGSDDLEGCKHAVFEILSNAIDEAREGHGDTIIVTRYEDLSVEIEDFGRGIPLDWNEKEGRYKINDFEFTVLHTPGHTEGSVCYIFGDNIFSGDTLFRGAIGRTDFFGGNMTQMLNSLRRLKRYPGEFKVYPGHGSSTQLSYERQFNPYMVKL